MGQENHFSRRHHFYSKVTTAINSHRTRFTNNIYLKNDALNLIQLCKESKLTKN